MGPCGPFGPQTLSMVSREIMLKSYRVLPMRTCRHFRQLFRVFPEMAFPASFGQEWSHSRERARWPPGFLLYAPLGRRGHTWVHTSARPGGVLVPSRPLVYKYSKTVHFSPRRHTPCLLGAFTARNMCIQALVHSTYPGIPDMVSREYLEKPLIQLHTHSM